jgi:tetratricopeptide (TPR) repeat protein
MLHGASGSSISPSGMARCPIDPPHAFAVMRLIARRPVLAFSVAFLVFTQAAVSWGQERSVACSPGESPSFLSAASDIRYGCGYLLESSPPNYAGASTYFRQAVAKEPNNAVARYLLGVSLAGMGEAEAAMAAFAEATRLDPQILDRINPLFERRPALRPAVQGSSSRTTPRATPSSSTPGSINRGTDGPTMFAVGARVEIEYRPGEWFPGVVTRADAGTCPYYRVRADVYGNGSSSDLGYGCKSVRAPTGLSQPIAGCGGSNPNCAPKSPPPLGRYTCNVTRWDVAERRVKYDYKGYFELLAGSRYRWLDNGGVGTYLYNPTSHAVTWGSGPLKAQGGRARFGLDGATPEVTIVMETEYTRSTGNAPIEWQCALESR